MLNALVSAEADAVCGAEYGVASPQRTNSRNGYRHRDLDSRVGTIDVAIPKLRQGSRLAALSDPRSRTTESRRGRPVVSRDLPGGRV